MTPMSSRTASSFVTVTGHAWGQIRSKLEGELELNEKELGIWFFLMPIIY